MRVVDIVKIMDSMAPSNLTDSWDNTGFQLGNMGKEVKKVLVALDLDLVTFKKAKEVQADMIITHHPLIFRPLKKITSESYKGKLILDIIKEDIAVYSAHTNLDIVDGGVNDVLAELLGLREVEVLKCTQKEPLEYGYGRIGNIDETPIPNFLNKLKEKLEVNNLKVFGKTDGNINRIALCGGSGGDFIQDAHDKSADIYITGDIKYHEAQLANELNLLLIDAGHYNTEKIILPEIRKRLEHLSNNEIEVIINSHNTAPFLIY